MIVEDEGIVAGHIAALLEKHGYKVVAIAASSEEVFAQIAESNPELILMDIRIQGALDGIDTTTKVLELFDIPIIYLTAQTDPATTERARLTGDFELLRKPVNQMKLIMTVEAAIRKHRAAAA